MRRTLVFLMFPILFACNGKQDDLNFYIKSRDIEEVRPLRLLFNQEPIIEIDLADNGIEENYNIFRTKVPQSSERIVRIELMRFEDTIANEIKIPSNGSYDVIIIVNSTHLYRDYSNSQIYEKLKYIGTSDFKGFADSLYDHGVIEEKFIEIQKDSVITISLLKI